MRSPSGPEVTDTGAPAEIFEAEPEQPGKVFELAAAAMSPSSRPRSSFGTDADIHEMSKDTTAKKT